MSQQTPTKGSWQTRWRLLGPLGQGGQGLTWRVADSEGTDSGEFVLKMLHQPKNKDRRGRMRREVESLRRLRIKGVPTLKDASQDEDPQPYIVMDYVRGNTLEKIIQAQPLAPAFSVELADQLLAIIEECHAQEIVHRDIKPDNIIINDALTDLSLVDFGLSVDEDEEISLTSEKHQVGNRFFLLSAHKVPGANKRDPASDVLMCAGVLFYSLTGQWPVMVTDDDGQPPHRRSNVQSRLAELSIHQQVGFARFFDKAFASRARERFQTAAEMRTALQQVLTGPDEAVEPAPTEVASLWTFHALRGVPESLYFNHRMSEEGPESDLPHHFQKVTQERGDVPLELLEPSLRDAVRVLWSEVSNREEFQSQIPTDAPFRNARDHVNHRLDASWLGGDSSTAEIYWGRERLLPNGTASGPRGALTIATLSSAGQAAVDILDQAARQAATVCLAEATRRMAEWDGQAR